jgi:8-amino-7-oxononanoate synthase
MLDWRIRPQSIDWHVRKEERVVPDVWKKFLMDERLHRDKLKLTRKLRSLRHLGSTKVQIGSHEFLNFSSNDYLGLTGDIRIAEAASSAAGRFGWGAAASRLVTGSSTLHTKLEGEIAAFRGTEAALVFGSGYQANLGVITALVGEGDTVVSDEMNHASIVAGCKLSGAAIRVFKHLDYTDMERQLNGIKKGKILAVTDSLFSVEGDVADLNRVVKLCDRFRALLVVDDAHANGCLGKRGRGVVEMQGVLAQVPIIVGNFSKAFGSYGGFVACNEEVRDFLVNNSRPFIYTTAIPVALAAANLEALRIVRVEGDHLRQRLATNTGMARSKLESAGFELTGNYQVFGIRVNGPEEAVFMGNEVEFHGILVHPMRWPTVPEGRDCLRVSITAAHTSEDIARLVEALKKARDALVKKRTDGLTRRASRRPDHQELNAAEPMADEHEASDRHPATQTISAADSSKLPTADQVGDFEPEAVGDAGDTLIMNPPPVSPDAPTAVVAKTEDDKPTKVESSSGGEKTSDADAPPAKDKSVGDESDVEVVEDEDLDDNDETDFSDVEDELPKESAGSTLAPESVELEDPEIAQIEGRTRKRKRKTATRIKKKTEHLG